MKDLSANSVLAGVAMVILGALGLSMLVEPIPAVNSTILGMIVGALAGALTVGGISKGADKLHAMVDSPDGTKITAITTNPGDPAP